jgi:hypothetical protein
VPELMALTALLLSFGGELAELADAPDPIPIGNMIIYIYIIYIYIQIYIYL